MNNFYKLIIFWILIISSTFEVKADNLLGMDASWRSLANDTFEISLVIYRRCDNAQPLVETLPTIVSDSCANAYNVTLDSAFYHSIEDITPVKPAYKPCKVANGNNSSIYGVFYGIERHTYKYKVYLGGNYANCCWYKIRYFVPSERFNTYEDFLDIFWLNRCYTNTSPVFTGDPMLWRCAGQDVCYKYGIIDSDNDSISINLSQPLGHTYALPNTYLYPVTCLGGNISAPYSNPPTGFNVNQQYCNLWFRPLLTSTAIIKMEVKEWRMINGQFKIIGITNRDLQLSIMSNCNNYSPTISGFYSNSVCSGQQNCITFDANDQNLGDTTYIYSNSNTTIPGSTFTTDNGQVKRAGGTFCWTPADSAVNSSPYYFNLTASDDHLPIYRETIRSYKVVVSLSPKYSTLITYLGKGMYKFNASPTDTSKSFIYSWFVPKKITDSSSFIFYAIGIDTSYQFQSSGTYIIQSSANLNGCIVYRYDTIMVACAQPLNLVSSNDTIICNGNLVQLSTNATNGLAPFKYEWYFNNSIIDSVKSFSITPMQSGQYIVKVQSSDSCTTYGIDTVFVTIDTSRLSLEKLNDTFICQGSKIRLISNAQGKAPLQFFWYRNNSLISTDSILNDTPSVPTTYILKAISADKCFNTISDTFSLNFYSHTLQLSGMHDTIICSGDPLTLKAQVIGGITPYHYNWCPQGKGCSSLPNPIYTFDTITQVFLDIVSSDVCNEIKRDTMTVYIYPLKQLAITSSNKIINKGNSAILKTNNGSNLIWSGAGIISIWGDSIRVQPDTTTSYKVIGLNSNGCNDTAEIIINVNPVGIKNKGNANDLKIHIINNSGEFAIEMPAGADFSNATIFDALGKELPIKFNLSYGKPKFNLDSYKSGFYFLIINSTNGKVWIKKIIKE